MQQTQKVLWIVLSLLFLDFGIFGTPEKMTQDAMDVCLQVLKESDKINFDSYCVRNSVLVISQITFPDCCSHFFAITFLETGAYGKVERGTV